MLVSVVHSPVMILVLELVGHEVNDAPGDKGGNQDAEARGIKPVPAEKNMARAPRRRRPKPSPARVAADALAARHSLANSFFFFFLGYVRRDERGFLLYLTTRWRIDNHTRADTLVVGP